MSFGGANKTKQGHRRETLSSVLQFGNNLSFLFVSTDDPPNLGQHRMKLGSAVLVPGSK